MSVNSVVVYENSATVPAGQVIRTDPVPGTVPILPGMTITVYVSLGPADLPVPNLIGQAIENVPDILLAANMIKGIVSYQPVALGSEYFVTAQSPGSGVQAGSGSPVNYTVGVPGIVQASGQRPRGRRH